MFNVISYQRNTNKSYFVIPSHPFTMVVLKKTKDNQAGKDEEDENLFLFTVDGIVHWW